MQDEKYMHLREKLDTLQYTETLHPHSVALVERILNDLIKFIEKFQEIKVIKTADKTQNNLQYQLDLINEKYHEVKQQNNILKKKLQNYSNQSSQRYYQQLQNMKRQNKQLSRITNELSKMNELIAKQYQQMKLSQDKKSKENQKRLNHFKNELKLKDDIIEELHHDKNKLLQTTLKQFKIKQQSQQQQINISNHTCKQLAQQLQGFKLKLTKSKQQNQKLKMAIKILNQQLYSIKKHQEFNTQSTDNTNVDTYVDEHKNIIREYQETIIEYQKKRIMDEEQINTQTLKIKQLNSNIKKNLENISILQNLNKSITEKYKSLQKQYENSQKIRISLQAEKQVKLKQIPKQQLTTNTSQSYFDDKENKFKQIIFQLNQQIHNLTSINDCNTKDLHRYKMEITKLQNLNSSLQKQLQISTTQKQSHQKHIQQLQKSNLQLRNVNTLQKQTCIKNQYQINQHELILEDLKSKIANKQIQIQKLRDTINNMQALLTKQKTSNTRLYEDNKSLKQLISQLEDNKQQYFQKCTQMKSQQENNLIKTEKNLNDLSSARKSIKQLQNKLKDKQLALITIDNQRDQLQTILDTKTIELNDLKKNNKIIEQSNKELLININDTQMQLNIVNNKYKQQTDKLNKIKQELQNKQQELPVERQRRKSIESSNKQVQRQLNLVVMSNKQYKRQNNQLKTDFNQCQQKYGVKIQQIQEIKDKYNQLSLQHAQLIQSYQHQRTQNAKLRGFIHELQIANNQIYNHIQHKDQQLNQLNTIYKQIQANYTKSLRQIDSYERQLSSFSQQVQKHQERFIMISIQRDKLREQSINTQKLMQSDWKKNLQQKNIKLSTECQIKSIQNQALKDKVREYEKIIEEQRIRNMTLSNSINTLQKIQSPKLNIKKLQIQTDLSTYKKQQLNILTCKSDRSHTQFQPSVTATSAKKFHEHLQKLQQNYALTKRQQIRLKNKKQLKDN